MIDLLDAARSPRRLWWDLTHSQQPLLWIMALVVGTVSAYAALIFWWAVTALQNLSFGASETELASAASEVAWWRVLIVPTLGGLVIGLALHMFVPQKRIWGVADVIEARLLRRAKLSRRAGLWSAVLSILGLGFGMSAGREGPVVHMSATIASYASRELGIRPVARRMLVGCGVAAAVSASFNAPIAGVLFALEVVLGHYALSAFAPIVIASAAGTVVSRFHLGNAHVFDIPAIGAQSYWEMPAFFLLGVVSALMAVIFTKAVFLAEDVGNNLKTPVYVRTTLGGLFVGLLAISFPQVLGVGYETTDSVLQTAPSFWALIALIAAKTAATAAVIGSRAGGGVFSPSLFLGIMVGVAFWYPASAAFPDLAGDHTLYGIVGMGAVSAAVLGAPISTTLICFELTGNYQVALFVMVAASVASVLTQYFIGGGGIFLAQLERRGLPVYEGPDRLVLDGVSVADIAHKGDAVPPGISLRDDTPRVTADTSLHEALMIMDKHDIEAVWIVDESAEKRAIGVIKRSDAYKALSRALLDVHSEEHR